MPRRSKKKLSKTRRRSSRKRSSPQYRASKRPAEEDPRSAEEIKEEAFQKHLAWLEEMKAKQANRSSRTKRSQTKPVPPLLKRRPGNDTRGHSQHTSGL